MAALAQGPTSTRLTIPGDQLAVRDGLRALFDSLLLRGLTEADRGAAEIVLAEALNNIVEHAYRAQTGEIDITLQMRSTGLVCTIIDSGAPMPGAQLPEGGLDSYDDVTSLPEGGFGWHLIRALSSDLRYQREDDRNCLQFRLDTQQSGI